MTLADYEGQRILVTGIVAAFGIRRVYSFTCTAKRKTYRTVLLSKIALYGRKGNPVLAHHMWLDYRVFEKADIDLGDRVVFSAEVEERLIGNRKAGNSNLRFKHVFVRIRNMRVLGNKRGGDNHEEELSTDGS